MWAKTPKSCQASWHGKQCYLVSIRFFLLNFIFIHCTGETSSGFYFVPRLKLSPNAGITTPVMALCCSHRVKQWVKVWRQHLYSHGCTLTEWNLRHRFAQELSFIKNVSALVCLRSVQLCLHLAARVVITKSFFISYCQDPLFFVLGLGWKVICPICLPLLAQPSDVCSHLKVLLLGCSATSLAQWSKLALEACTHIRWDSCTATRGSGISHPDLCFESSCSRPEAGYPNRRPARALIFKPLSFLCSFLTFWSTRKGQALEQSWTRPHDRFRALQALTPRCSGLGHAGWEAEPRVPSSERANSSSRLHPSRCTPQYHCFLSTQAQTPGAAEGRASPRRAVGEAYLATTANKCSW